MLSINIKYSRVSDKSVGCNDYANFQKSIDAQDVVIRPYTGWKFLKINSGKFKLHGKFPKSSQPEECNKTMYVGIFQKW